MSEGDFEFDPGEGELDEFDAFLGGEEFGGSAIAEGLEGRGEPGSGGVLVAEDGDGASDHGEHASGNDR